MSFVAGSLTGIVYGLSFGLFRKRRVLSLLVTTARLFFVGIFFFYLLRYSSIHFIILLPTFLIMFWLIVLNKKATRYEGF